MARRTAVPATKGDHGRLRRELQSEFREFRRFMRDEFAGVHARLDKLEQNLNFKIDEGVSKMLKLAEGFAVQNLKVSRDQTISNYRVDELEKRVKILEARA